MSGEEGGPSRRRPPPEPLAVLRGHLAEVQALTFAGADAGGRGAQQLLSGDSDGKVKVWDLGNMRPVTTCRLHNIGSGVTALAVSPDGGTLLSQGRDGMVKLAPRLPDGSISSDQASTICTGSYNFCRVSPLWSPLGTAGSNVLGTAGSDPGHAEVWDMTSRSMLMRLHEDGSKRGMCTSMALFSPALRHGCPFLLVGYEDGTMALWDSAMPREPMGSIRVQQEPVMALSLAPDCTGAVCCGPEQTLSQIAVSTSGPEALRVLRTAELRQPGASSIAVRWDQKIFVVGGWDDQVSVFGYRKCKPLARLPYHVKGVADVAFSTGRETSLLASASRDQTIALWDIYNPPGVAESKAT